MEAVGVQAVVTLRIALSDGSVKELEVEPVGLFAVHHGLQDIDGAVEAVGPWTVTHFATGRVVKAGFDTVALAESFIADIAGLTDWGVVTGDTVFPRAVCRGVEAAFDRWAIRAGRSA